jgi:glycosyltransferase involved in cell wall biosynthesis
MRAMNLANALLEKGHEVVIWSSSFFHQEKRHRSREFESLPISERLTINLIPSSGYTRHIGLRRLIDHAQLALNLEKLLSSGKFQPPDAAFVGFPPIEIAAVMTRWLKTNKVPTVIDAKDQWPTIFVEPFPNWIRPIGKLALLPYFYLTRRAMNDATEFCAMTDEFVDWMSEVSGRARTDADLAAPLTAPRGEFPEEELRAATAWWANQGVDPGTRRRISFVGSLSPAFDFEIVRQVARRCIDEGVDCQFVICGEGSESKAVRKLLARLNNVVMPGWIDAPKISVLTSCSTAMMAPYINNDAFMRSIPNKVVDSLANGVPIVTTLKGVVANLIAKEKIGISTDSEAEMFKFVLILLNEDKAFSQIVDRVKAVHDSKFSYQRVYGQLSDRLIRLAVQC